jgi:hypothetical protein
MNLLDYAFEKNMIDENLLNIIINKLINSSFFNKILYEIAIKISQQNPKGIITDELSPLYKLQKNYDNLYDIILNKLLESNNKEIVKKILINENFKFSYKRKTIYNLIKKTDLNETDLLFIIENINEKYHTPDLKNILEEYLLNSNPEIMEFFINKSIEMNKKFYLTISINILEKTQNIDYSLNKIEIILNNNNIDSKIKDKAQRTKENILKTKASK